MNRRVVLELQDRNVSDFVPMAVTMILGIANMLNIPEIIKVLAGGIYLGTLLFLPATQSIKYLMFSLCANELLDIGSTSLTMIFAALFCAIQSVFRLKESKIPASVFLSLYALAALGLIAFFVVDTKESLVNTVKHIFFLFYTANVIEENRGNWKKLYTEVFQYMGLGVIFYTLLSIAINGLPSLSVRFTPADEITINFFGIVGALAIVNLLYSSLILKDNAKLNMLLIMGCVLGGLLTQSRTFILAVGIGAVLIFLFTSSIKLKFQFLTIGTVCALTILMIYSTVPTIAERIDAALLRLLDPSDGDISNGRYDLWSTTINTMMSNPAYIWFGAGDYKRMGAIDEGKARVAHNLFLETWVIYGVIGCVLLILIYIIFLKRYVFSSMRAKLRMVTFSPIIVMLCSFFYSHHFIGRSMSLVFVLSFLPIVIGIPEENGGYL